MKKEELFAEILRQNPQWHTDGAMFNRAGIKKFFDLVWSVAEKNANAELLAAAKQAGKAAGSPFSGKGFEDALGNLFGGLGKPKK